MSVAVQVLAQDAGIFLAGIAAFLALRAEYRSHLRFKEQLRQSRELAERNARPLLHVMQHSFDNEGGLMLYNNGAGVAVVKHVACSRAGESSSDIVNVLGFDDVTWDEFTELADEFHIQPREALTMVQLTLDHLIEQGYSDDVAREMLEQLEKQLDETTVRVTYEDVFGNVIAESEQLHP